MSEFNLLFSNLLSINTNVDLAEQILPSALSYLNYSDEINKKLFDINATKKSHLNNYNSTERWGYRTTFSLDNIPGITKFIELDETKELKKYILSKASDFLLEYGYSEYHSKRIIITTFINEIREGEEQGFHTHPDTLLSGVFYLQVPGGSSPIVFNDPRPHTFLLKEDDWVTKKTLSNHREIVFTPKVGDLLLWNSWLPHCVPVSKESYSEGRISVVFNIIKNLQK
jgi:uncharacterized protein (TIGR02466 family)